MPKDPSLHKILLIGSGPIVIGQGCEFDYSGVQACKALKEEGYTVILVNSNPATIMTDPEFAHRTYIEPITPEVVEKIIEREKPDALLPTLGGQTALNCAMKLFESGVLEKHGVKMIGANAAAIHKGEDRQAFKEAMIKIGLDMPRSGTAHTMEEARVILQEMGTLPLIIRPAFTLGGSGGGIAYNKEEFEVIVARGLDLSPVSEVLIEESLLGWKEFEMEVMRDRADNCVIICSIENVDPMGVHTGDSITVAPIQTLTDREFQVMRDASFAIIREIGVETGGSNIQFAVHPETGRMIVIEMNPRVSRSSALASKATGFPIAKIAAKLAVGYTLDEVRNDITRETPASFEPTIDYVVVKCPRFTFEKFPQADPVLTTQMKSVGEAMAIGRTFKEALQKALRSLEIKRFGLIGDGKDAVVDDDTLRTKLTVPNAERIFFLGLAFQRGWSVEEIFEMTKIDRWFLENIREIVEALEDSRPRLSGQAAVPAAGQAGGPSSRTGETPVFRGFDPHGEITATRRHLPHFQQQGATYFVTFRLADSIPNTLLNQWRDELASWLKFHPEPWDYQTARDYELRFVEGREKWLDEGHGECLLREPQTAEIVAHALRHFDGDRYWIEAFVVMPNHIHVLVQPRIGHTLPDILHSWKSFAAHAVNKALGRKGALWMEESHDRIVRDWEALGNYRDYIEANPEKAGLKKGFVLWKTSVPLVTEDGPPACQPAAGQAGSPSALTAGTAVFPDLRRAKKLGFSDRQLAIALGTTDTDIRAQRTAAGIIPTYRLVDTCAAEFEAYTPYYYSTYGDENERRDSGKKKIIILGGGPNRIGQGIEFDYCCVHAAFALREEGFETIMVNSNPETVSTDYDTSDKLYFEPLTLEDVLNICEQESENLFGVIVQFGGQTPLNLAAGLQAAGVPIIGTSPHSIEIAEDRKLFGAMLDKLGIRQTAGGTATTEEEAVTAANAVGYPVLVRPSFVLGGRGMQLVHNETDLRRYVRDAIDASGRVGVPPAGSGVPPERSSRTANAPTDAGKAATQDASLGGQDAHPTREAAHPTRAEHPILVDHFLEDAVEVDVDCISDGEIVVIGAIMEHIEEAGIHSGDSSCVIPSFSLKPEVKAEITRATKAMAKELNVRGLMNVQFAVKDDVVYVLEVNPRASRTAPFVSKAIGVQLPKLAAKIMAGKTLKELGFTEEIHPKHFSVKEAVFPFIRFPGIDIVLGPEMKSTGEVMGMGENLGLAFAKAQMAAQPALPTKGNIFISVADRQKTKIAELARGFVELGFTLYATNGTAAALQAAKLPVKKLFKLNEGRPNALDMIKNGELAMIINTPSGKVAREDEVKIRSTATGNRIPIITTLRAATASLEGIRALREHGLSVKALQEYHP